MWFAGDGFSAEAFGVAPAPSLPFLSTPLRQVERDIRGAMQARAALVVLSGLEGVGKTTLSLTFAAALTEEGWRVARWDGEDGRSAQAGPAAELVLTACEQAGVALPRFLADKNAERGNGRRWRGFGRGRALCVIVDDADTLADETLAELAEIARQAASEPPGGCLILIGTLLLGDRLRRLLAEKQSDVLPVEVVMLPLPASEIEAYLHHRLARAGAIDVRLFTFDAIAQIAAHTKGIPQHINHLCLTVLEHTRLGRGQRIGGVTIDEAAAACRLAPQMMVDDTGAFHIVAVDTLEPSSSERSGGDATSEHGFTPSPADDAMASPLPEEPAVSCTTTPKITVIEAEPVVISAQVHRMMASTPATAPDTLAVPMAPANSIPTSWLRPALAGAAAMVLAIDVGLTALYGIDADRFAEMRARIHGAWAVLIARDAAPASSMAAIAASSPSAPAATASSPDAPPMADDADLDALVQRGQKLLDRGDHLAARLVLEHAAAKGSARAALLLAQSYDPVYVARSGGDGIRPEPEIAAGWYRKAEELERQATAAGTAPPLVRQRQPGSGQPTGPARAPGA